MMPGMDPRMEALTRAMPPEEMGAPMPPEGGGAGDPSAELMDIAMRLESILPALDPAIAEQIAQVLPLLQEAAAPKPEGVPQMGPEGVEDVGMGAPV